MWGSFEAPGVGVHFVTAAASKSPSCELPFLSDHCAELSARAGSHAVLSNEEAGGSAQVEPQFLW